MNGQKGWICVLPIGLRTVGDYGDKCFTTKYVDQYGRRFAYKKDAEGLKKSIYNRYRIIVSVLPYHEDTPTKEIP